MLQTIETLVKHWVTFVKGHEKLLIILILAIATLRLADKGFNAYGQHLANNVKTDNTAIAQIEKQNADNAALLAKAIDTMNQRVTADEAIIAKAKTTIIVQQQKNNAMTTPQLDTHWEQDLLKLPAGNITANTDGTSTVSQDAAHKTVNALDTIQPITDQLGARSDELTQCTTVRTQQATQITGLTTDIAAEKKGRDDDAKQAKHDIHAAWLRGFKWGYGAGVATVIVIKAVLHVKNVPVPTGAKNG